MINNIYLTSYKIEYQLFFNLINYQFEITSHFSSLRNIRYLSRFFTCEQIRIINALLQATRSKVDIPDWLGFSNDSRFYRITDANISLIGIRAP